MAIWLYDPKRKIYAYDQADGIRDILSYIPNRAYVKADKGSLHTDASFGSWKKVTSSEIITEEEVLLGAKIKAEAMVETRMNAQQTTPLVIHGDPSPYEAMPPEPNLDLDIGDNDQDS